MTRQKELEGAVRVSALSAVTLAYRELPGVPCGMILVLAVPDEESGFVLTAHGSNMGHAQAIDLLVAHLEKMREGLS